MVVVIIVTDFLDEETVLRADREIDRVQKHKYRESTL